MSSDVDICNRALIRAGAKGKISSLAEDTPNAVLCSLLYEPNRKNLLRKHFWNFALVLVSLPQLVDVPVFEYTYAYQLPSDCLRLVKLFEFVSPWKIIGRQLHSDDNTIDLVYVSDFTDAAQFDVMFEEALVLKIAYEICLKLNENDNRANILKQEFERTVREARQIDGMEDYPDQWGQGSWNDSRDISRS